MATLSELVKVVSDVTKVPEATVFAYGRFAREQGHISQKGRGHGAASMTARDAANLLIAIGGTATTRDAGAAITSIRPLRGCTVAKDSRAAQVVMDWMTPLGWRRVSHRLIKNTYRLNANFGEVLDFLIERGSDLNGVLRSIPAIAEPGSAANYFLDLGGVPAETIAARGGKLKAPGDIAVGSDVGITLKFNRTTETVTAEFGKPSAHTGAFRIWFSDNDDDKFYGDFEVEARLSELTIAAASACLAGRPLPKKPKHLGHFRDALFPSIFESRERR